MLAIRTTKKVQTSLHTDETQLVEFQFAYTRDKEGLYVKCDAYRVVPGNEETLELIPGGGSYRRITLDQVVPLMDAVLQITPEVTDENVNFLDKFDALVASGIKIVITNEGLWKNQLTVNDFE